MIIIVTGTPGTGKTTVSKILAKSLHYRYLDVKKRLSRYGLKTEYDIKRRCFIIDIRKLKKCLMKEISKSKNLIIDSHLSHYLPKKYVDLCIVTKVNLKQLKKRLKKRKYSEEKVRENLDAEIFDICLNEAKEIHHKIILVDTSKKINIVGLISEIKIMNKIKKKRNRG